MFVAAALTAVLAEKAEAQTSAEMFTECLEGQRDDEDGIALLENACTLTLNDSIWHDAVGTHDFCRETLEVGCDIATDCLGRCSAGCGASGGAGVYSVDCAEHDRCCRVHGGCLNPFDIQCGDEFDEATDDTLFGTPNSQGCVGTLTDIYFLVDLSGSFADDLPNFKAQAPAIISTLTASNPNTYFGLGKFEDYPISPFGSAAAGDKAYERLVDLTCDTQPVLSTIAALFTRFGGDFPQSQLPTLFQAATGQGQDLSGAGFPEASIPPGQQANFRDGANKLFLLWTDAPFHNPGDPGAIPYPGPSFSETVDAILALDPPKVIGISSGSFGLPDLEAIAAATNSFAPPGGVDCDNDGLVDVLEGEPLVCEISFTGEGIGEAIVAIVRAASVLPVQIDIKPGSFPNGIDPRSKGVIPVAILTTETFDATTVDPLSVAFGPGAAAETHGRGHLEDANSDGVLDIVLHFRTQDAAIQCGDPEASLAGHTVDGVSIEGLDSIRTVGCK